jgi:beta-xylosidase
MDISKITTVVRPLRRAALLALVVAPILLVAAPIGGDEPVVRDSPAQPTPTATPSAPGIAIAMEQFDLPDPFLLTDGGTYYMYLSSAFGNTQHVPMVTGEPGHWSTNSVDAVPLLPQWATGGTPASELTWSPAVYKVGRTFVIYLAPEVRGTVPAQHCIAVGTSPDPAGPFQIDPDPFLCQQNLGGDIDPQMFVDPAGPEGPSHPNYFVWKSDNNSTPGDGTPTIWAQPLSNDGLHLLDQPSKIFAPDESWQLSLVEAPQMALSPTSQVWLFYSGGKGFFSPDYGMGAARCAGPLGPCEDARPGPLIASNAQGAGPGEETYFVAPDGSDWLLYSPIHTGVPLWIYRPVEAARIGWDQSGPYVANAGTFPSPSQKWE